MTTGDRDGMAPRPIRLRFDGLCSRCGTPLTRGTDAVWDPASRTVHCIECPARGSDTGGSIVEGVAGASARREHERRTAKRNVETRSRWGDRLGGLILKVSEDPISTRAWSIGAAGEEKLARELVGIDGIRLLHDRRIPGSRANIDHIVVAPGGVFVVDAKNYRGLIRVQDRGPFWREDLRLLVGGRDCSALADGLIRQVDAVVGALVGAGEDPVPRITPVLCFVDGEWPLIRRPREFRGVELVDEGSIKPLLIASSHLRSEAIDRWSRVLSERLPPR